MKSSISSLSSRRGASYSPALTRRRFVSILAASATAAGGQAQAAPVARWTGRAMGAPARMHLRGLEPEDARSTFRAVERELARLERIFSLYDRQSQLVQLNDTGRLRAPAPELLEVLSVCHRLHDASFGVFDPTVQPYWRAVAEAAEIGSELSQADYVGPLAACGWDRLRVDFGEVRIENGGALTLNGIAQGYITDRIADLLKARGLRDVLIDMGEIATVGKAPWSVGIALPDGSIVDRITLSDRALATSAPEGTMLQREAGLGHIVDPRDPARRPMNRLVSVSASNAALADGLSTALCLLGGDELVSCLTAFPDAKLETVI